MLTTKELFDLSHTMAGEYLAVFEYPWQALPGIRTMVLELAEKLGPEYHQVSPQVWVHETAEVAPSAYLAGPCIVGAGSEIRHCAFLRGSILIGEGCVVGNSVELKNAILFDGVQVPHFNYVGDSILGHKAHMGAGAVTSNVKSDKTTVTVRNGEEKLETGLKKFGAVLGDHVEIGCNAVLNPGTVLGKHTNVYPTSCVRGVVPADSIWKNDGTVVKKKY